MEISDPEFEIEVKRLNWIRNRYGKDVLDEFMELMTHSVIPQDMKKRMNDIYYLKLPRTHQKGEPIS